MATGKSAANTRKQTVGAVQETESGNMQPLAFDVRIHSIKPGESIKGTASVNINGAFCRQGSQDY